MPDWTKSMQRTYEFYTVDPGTWKDVEKLENVVSCSIDRDISAETLGSASFDVTDLLGEAYIRVYMITIQNGITEKHPLGTFLVQTPSSTFDGKKKSVQMDAYTPLLELKENSPPIGYFIAKKENIMDMACLLVGEHARAPVVIASASNKLYFDFVSDTDDTWLTFLSDLIANAKFKFDLDELGRILFAPEQDTASLQPVWTYTDDNSSILLPEIDLDHDLYQIPNAVEVIYSEGGEYFYAKVVNDDPNSPISTVNRGREILHRVVDPDLNGDPTERQIDDYAEQLLRELSTLEYTVTYSHAYCPVRVGDCVLLNYTRAELSNVKAKVISQSIDCNAACTVSETAVFTKKLWG